MDERVRLRAANDNDRNLVIDSWIKSYGKSPWARMCGAAYDNGHDALIKALLPRAAVLVACWDETPDLVIGWACTEGPIVHYVYVRHLWRGKGIAKMLLAPYVNDKRVVYTHVPKQNAKPLPDGWYFNPYPAFVVGNDNGKQREDDHGTEGSRNHGAQQAGRPLAKGV